MEINNIFVVVKDRLYSVQYDIHDTHEWRRLLELWQNADYLRRFFEIYQDDLLHGYYKDFTIDDAILKTQQEAVLMEKKIIHIAQNPEKTLSSIFKPLYNDTSKVLDYEMDKAKNHWLRIYAIRIDQDLFVVSGGGIKLTKTMNEREHLLEELKKLAITQNYLRDDDSDNLDIFELT